MNDFPILRGGNVDDVIGKVTPRGEVTFSDDVDVVTTEMMKELTPVFVYNEIHEENGVTVIDEAEILAFSVPPYRSPKLDRC